jgi:uncharacterized protein
LSSFAASPRNPERGLWAALFALMLSLLGCAGHAGRTEEIRSALDVGDPKRALALLNEELEVDSAKQLPADMSGDNAILVLDRAMVLQQLDQYTLSSRDLEAADKAVEVLDLSRNAADEIGKYLFSDDTGPYKAPAYEKLMVNSMNLVNYLVRGDLNGARIEARRLAVMQKFIKEHQDPAFAMMGPGSYLAGFAFEKSGRPQEALRYYDEALQYGAYRSLDEPIRRLAARTAYRSPRIRGILGEAPPEAPPAPKSEADPRISPRAPPAEKPAEAPEKAVPPEKPAAAPAAPARETDGELLVVVSFGRVPAKYAKRIPIGLALTYASGALSPHDRARANGLALQGLVTWVNFPALGRPRGQYEQPEFALDGAWMPLEGMLAVDREAARAWEEVKGTVVASAIARMIARVVAGEAARRATGGGVTGLLVSLGTQATLTATDTPDTRSWSTLPARIAFGRLRMRPGTHWVQIGARGVRKTQRVSIRPGGFAVVNLTVLH